MVLGVPILKHFRVNAVTLFKQSLYLLTYLLYGQSVFFLFSKEHVYFTACSPWESGNMITDYQTIIMPWCDIIPWTPFKHNGLTRIPPMTWLWVKSLYSDVNLRLFFFCFAFYGPFKNISLMLSPLLSRGRRITTWPSINRNGLSKMCSAKAWSCIYLCLSSQSMSWFYVLWHILYIQGQVLLLK